MRLSRSPAALRGESCSDVIAWLARADHPGSRSVIRNRSGSVLLWKALKMRRHRKENAMPIYVTLLRFTEKGIQHVKDTVKRSEAYRSRAKKHGATVKEIIWTQGAHDIVTIVEAPDDETASAFILSADELGNVRSETLRGFTAAEMEKLLAKVD